MSMSDLSTHENSSLSIRRYSTFISTRRKIGLTILNIEVLKNCTTNLLYKNEVNRVINNKIPELSALRYEAIRNTKKNLKYFYQDCCWQKEYQRYYLIVDQQCQYSSSYSQVNHQNSRYHMPRNLPILFRYDFLWYIPQHCAPVHLKKTGLRKQHSLEWLNN